MRFLSQVSKWLSRGQLCDKLAGRVSMIFRLINNPHGRSTSPWEKTQAAVLVQSPREPLGGQAPSVGLWETQGTQWVLGRIDADARQWLLISCRSISAH